ncbi:MAG: type II toxin-antitoxin system HipA family toxin [Verrucomicrobiota bacterium]
MPTTEERLEVFLNDLPLGSVYRASGGKLRFRYDENYLTTGSGIPFSLSMPLVGSEYPHEKVHPFLWGLLPDNEQLLQHWASRFHVSTSNAFGLLRETGEDCAGAIRFIREDRLNDCRRGGKDPLSEADVERRLAEIKRDPALGREPGDRGQFSLAGAQAKTALQRVDGRWFLPWGTEPTTHILKPPRPELSGHVENEHFCLQLARRLGLSVATSEIVQFGTETAIVIARYDRTKTGESITRVHQEDMCQALSVHPAKKYENEGGPGVRAIMDLLNQSSNPHEDRDRFMRAVVFNYVILGSDAHAKNYSLLLGAGGRARLAPLYDIASLLPYAQQPRDRRLAMRVDRAYRDDQIRPHHFEKMARQCEYSSIRIREIIHDYIQRIPILSESLGVELRQNGIKHPILQTVNECLQLRCHELAERFGC